MQRHRSEVVMERRSVSGSLPELAACLTANMLDAAAVNAKTTK
jgi:hypothetical protein